MKDRRRVCDGPLRWELAWLAGACLVFWWLRVFQSNGNQVELFVNYDVLMYWIPLLREAAAQWRQYTVPLWNPYQAFGTPLLATQQVAALYPLNALYLILQPGTAWLVTGLAHQLLAGLGMYALCRVLGLSRGAALVGAGAYAFSAVVIEKYIDLPDEFICVAWLPAMFACAEMLLQEPTLTHIGWLALVWALHILGGDADTIARSALLLSAYVAVRVAGQLARAPRQALIGAAASAFAAALAVGLTALQWMPTLELVRHSVRALGSLNLAQQSGFSADLWPLFTNRVRGVPTLSIGSTLPLMLALIGVSMWPRRLHAWFFGLGAVLVALVSLGPTTPLFALTRYLPSGTWFRVPSRFLNLWPLCIAPLAAAGAEAVFAVAAPAGGRRTAWLAAASVAIVLVLQALGAARTHQPTAWLVAAGMSVVPLLLVAAAIIASRPAAETCSYAAVITFLLICAAPTVLFQPEILSPYRTAALYDVHAELFAALREQAPARVLSLLPVADGRSWAKLGTYFEVPVLSDFEPLTLADFRVFAEGLLGEREQPASIGEVLNAFTGDTAPPHSAYNSALLNVSGVRLVVADAANEAEVARWFGNGPRLVPWRRSGSALVYENTDALPRVFFVPAGGARAAGPDCVQGLARGDLDPRKELLLEEAPPMAATDKAQGTSSVDLSRYTPSAIQLGVTTGQAGYVVLTDAYFLGWTARVDGVDAPIGRADCFFRAVAVPAGTHTVVFSYAPWSFRFGCLVSSLAVVIAGAMLLIGRTRWVSNRRHFT